MVYRCGFADNRKVSAGTDRYIVADDLIAQILRIGLLKSKPVVLLILIPVLKTDYEVDVGGVLYGTCTEQCLDVHNADTAQLDKVLCHIRSGTDKGIIAHLADLHHVICHETVSSLYELQSRLRLTDATLAGNQHALTIDIHQYTMHGNAGSELYVEPADCLRHKGGSRLLCREHGDPMCKRLFQKDRIGLQFTAENKCREIIAHHLIADFPLSRLLQITEIAVFYKSDDL